MATMATTSAGTHVPRINRDIDHHFVIKYTWWGNHAQVEWGNISGADKAPGKSVFAHTECHDFATGYVYRFCVWGNGDFSGSK
jgi:hypothetical protein